MARRSVLLVVSGLLLVVLVGCDTPTQLLDNSSLTQQPGILAQLPDTSGPTEPPDTGSTELPDTGSTEPPDIGGSSSARWIDDRALFSAGFGQVSFVAHDGNSLTAWIYRSTGYQPAQGPIWFVMHGVDRDADRYIAA